MYHYTHAALAMLLIAASTPAAEPTLRSFDIRGLKIGGTTTLTVDGDDLGKTPRLLLPFEAKQALKPGATDKKASFDVTLGEVEPGYYQLRVVSEGGVSLPGVIGVDRMTQQLVAEPIKDLPVALHGAVAGSNIVEVKFQGKAKEKIMIEVESQRLGGKLRPILHLYSPKKLQIAWSWTKPQYFGDTRLEATLPEDGIYTATLHDAEYAAPAPSFFRMRIGNWSYVDQVFPPVIAKDQSVKVIAPNFAADVKGSGQFMPLSFPKAGVWSGPRPFVMVSGIPEFVGTSDPSKLQEIPEGRVGVSGKLRIRNEEHRYRVAVKPNTKVKLEVFAERLGSPLDAALVIRNDKGAQLARAEDSPGTLDPVLEYTVPDKVTSIIVAVVDTQGRGGSREFDRVYRLVIDPQTVGGDGFKLFTTVQRISQPRGGDTVVPVRVDRKGGYHGPIELVYDPPMRGLSMHGASIPAGADGTLVTFARLDSVMEPVIISLRGRTEARLEQVVLVKDHPLERLQPWLATEIAIGRSNESAKDFAIDWRDLPENTSLVPASRLQLPVKVTRPMGKATVKLTLVTSQNTPLANNQPDPNKAIRQDKIGELNEKMSTADVTVLVPPELFSPTYDVTVQAELLDAAKKVIATAYAPVRRMSVNIPIAVKLAGPNRIETPFDAKKGAIVKIEGQIERREGLKADVALAVTGLPAGAKAEAVTVKADASTFAVNVNFPPTVAPGEFKGVKLLGSYAPDLKQPNVRVKSREVDVTFVLKAPIK
jgi:hypothetical protein